MPHRMYDTAIAFWGGMTSSIGVMMLQINSSEFASMVLWKMLMTGCVGIIGGIAGVLGKEIVYLIKRIIKKYRNGQYKN